MLKYLLIALILRVAIAIVPESVTSIGTLSLPNLLEVNDIFDLENAWSFYNGIRFDTGRLLLGKLGGSIWSKNRMTKADNEWTIEFMFRSSGRSQDLVFSETNGLSLFLAQSPNTKDFSNFGGPSEFDGFQFLLNNKEKQGLKIYANDGKKRIENSLDNVIGNCEFPYINSQVPFTIRVSYSASKQVFKVQMDNNLCFKTDKIKIPSNSYHIGVAGNVSPASEEVFEVLLLNYWDHLTEDAIDDHGLISDGELKVAVRKVVEHEEEKKQEQEFHSPAAIRESLMERNRKYREQIQQPNNQVPINDNGVLSQLILQTELIASRLDKMEASIKSIKVSNSPDSSSYDTSSLDDFKETLSKQYMELLESIAKLNQKVIGEVREQQFTIEELTKKVDVLMANHKEINFHTSKEAGKVNTYEASGNILRFTLFVIIVILIILAIGFYRLRHDVKHSKLL